MLPASLVCGLPAAFLMTDRDAEREFLAPKEKPIPPASASAFQACIEWALDERSFIFRFRVICIVFSAYATRIYLPHAWNTAAYTPVLSPVYRQQEHWATDPHGRHAIMAHVGCGLIMMAAVVVQLSAPLRSMHPLLHRLTGRVYVVAGAGALMSLRWLRSSSGAGSAAEGDVLMQAFIDASPVAWVVVTFLGVDAAARRRDYAAHRRLMLLSAGLAAQPILQRILNALVLCPLAMVMRSLWCLFMWDSPPWDARWGAPGSTMTLLFAPAALRQSSVGAGTALSGRASPYLFSTDGYGEAEQAAFGVSAWLALLTVLAVGWRNAGREAVNQAPAEKDGVEPDVAVHHGSLSIGLLLRASRKLAGRTADVFFRKLGRSGAILAAMLVWAIMLAGACAILTGLTLLALAYAVGFARMLPILAAMIATGLATPVYWLACMLRS